MKDIRDCIRSHQISGGAMGRVTETDRQVRRKMTSAANPQPLLDFRYRVTRRDIQFYIRLRCSLRMGMRTREGWNVSKAVFRGETQNG